MLGHHAPEPMNEKSGSELRVAYLSEVFHCLCVIPPVDFSIPCCDTSNRLRLSRRIFRIGTRYELAQPSSSGEIESDGTKPNFAEIKEPGIVPVFLGHFFFRLHYSQDLSKLTQIQQRDGLSTDCEKVCNQDGGLVHSWNQGFKNFVAFPIVTSKRVNIRIHHLMVWRRARVPQNSQHLLRGGAQFRIFLSPGVVKQADRCCQHLSACHEHRIVEAPAHFHSLIDGGNAPV